MGDRWKSIIDTENKVLESKIDGENRIKFGTISTVGRHVALDIEKGDLIQEQILFTEENEDMNTFKAIKKVHELTNHKSAEQLLKHYRRADLIGPETVKTIKRVVQDCKICQKFGKKHVLWCIDSFTRFIQGNLLRNKKAETILI